MNYPSVIVKFNKQAKKLQEKIIFRTNLKTKLFKRYRKQSLQIKRLK